MRPGAALARRAHVPPGTGCSSCCRAAHRRSMALPAAGITLEDKQAATRRLLAAGADIHELNAVRKHLSAVKGGQLAAAAAGPGPRACDLGRGRRRPQRDRVGADGRRPDHVRGRAGCARSIRGTGGVSARGRRAACAARGASWRRRRSPATRASTRAAPRHRCRAEMRRPAPRGRAESLGYRDARARRARRRPGPRRRAPLRRGGGASRRRRATTRCVIATGETTVRVTGRGRGGRNQEFALSAARTLAGAAERRRPC